ncbi:MAG: CCA tRNA nucleotidyltransferase [Acidimicrobiaceae bacterium]|nr:CCA tRNA nucleotidyltransferase [Acidimicrobiaceae bacterium]MYB86955.1 CCA tRNA nucleotidyltransferase [Acidimicrobiaceae bacterium]MYH93432.1 CCA tRNA nucleotidyltransferase [Acidimicrobiaceae bacterium]
MRRHTVSAEAREALSADEALSAALSAASGLKQLFDAAGHRLYLVGGVVREAVAGRFLPDADLDCTTGARPATVRRIVSDAATSVWTQGERFGTIGCVVEGRAFEITTHRAERYERQSRKPVVAFGDDVVQDLARRDFTVNAMAIDTADGALIDPHGGRDDLVAGVLRTPLDPAVSFGDDPLRMLRAARFIASHGLAPDDALVGAVEAMGDRLDIVSVERVRDEFEKLLLLDDPSEGFRFLFLTGLIRRVVEDLARSDPAEVGRITAAVAAEPAARWASLFVRDSAETAAACLRRLRCSNELVSSSTALIAARARLAETSGSLVDVRRFVHACRAPVDSALAFAEAVATVCGEPRDRLHDFASTLAEVRRTEDVDNFVLPLDGDEVMAALGLDPGPEVGRALDFLRERAFRHGPSSKADAVEALQRWWAANYCDRS